ncbi:MAG TPA: glycosyltransferase family 39 protein [Candidatus Paceibacterota bacterium]
MTSLTRAQKIATVILFAIIVFFCLFRLTESPPFTFDEGWAVQIASNIAHAGIDGTQFTPSTMEHVPIVAIGYPLLYPLALWFKLFGAGVMQARLFMMLYMLGLAVVSFVFVRKTFGNREALAALAILATFPPLYAFGKPVFGEIPVLFWLMTMLLCFRYALSATRHRRLLLVLAGASAGLCVATKPMALVLLPVLVVGAVIVLRRRQASWKELAIVTVSALVPIIAWILVNFHDAGSLAHIADFYSNPSALTNKAAAFWASATFLVTTPGSLFGLGLLAMWLVGVIVRCAKKIAVPMEEWMALLFALIVLASFMTHYADARYLVPLQILSILFMPHSLSVILSALPKLRTNERARGYIFGTVIGLLTVGGLYQLSAKSYVAESYGSTLTHDMQAYFAAVPTTTKVLFYNATNAIPFFAGRDFYQRMVVFEKWQFGSDYAPLVKAHIPDMLVINSLSKADQQVSLTGYTQTAQLGKMVIYTRMTK